MNTSSIQDYCRIIKGNKGKEVVWGHNVENPVTLRVLALYSMY